MATLRLNTNPTFITEVHVRESDKHSEAVWIKFDRHIVPEEIRGCSEMFISPVQLEQLGRFLVRQADEIRTAQDIRRKTAIGRGSIKAGLV